MLDGTGSNQRAEIDYGDDEELERDRMNSHQKFLISSLERGSGRVVPAHIGFVGGLHRVGYGLQGLSVESEHHNRHATRNFASIVR